MLESVSSISCNNDEELGKIIAEAYTKVGKDGVVLMEESETEETYVEIVDGVQIDVDSHLHILLLIRQANM
jgi:chaperonin GroEL